MYSYYLVAHVLMKKIINNKSIRIARLPVSPELEETVLALSIFSCIGV